MPIYEYKCKACGRKFTVLRPCGGIRVQVRCPSCSKTETECLPSRFTPRPPSCCTTWDPNCAGKRSYSE
ncbi:MAG: FmdB family zinc ribbon protein [Armatimonadota bacterium]